MNEFQDIENVNLIKKASINMLKGKLEIVISENDDKFTNIFNNVFTNLSQKYKDNNNIDLRKLNTIFLNNIKTNYEKEINKDIVIETEQDTKLKDDYLDIKIKELEEIRNIVPDYSNIDDYNNIIKDKKIIEKVEKNVENNKTSIVNYNNLVNKKIYKTFIISSINRNWILKYYRNNINILINLELDFKKFNYIPHHLLMPSFVSLKTPVIKMKITNNNKDYYYSFYSLNKNTNWDLWNVVDNTDFELVNNNLNISFYDLNDDLIDLGYDNIKIINYIKETSNNLAYYKIFFDKNINYYNIFSINETIIIKINNKYIKKNIYNIDCNNNNSIYIIDNDNEIDNLNNSTILKYNDQFTLIIKYYIK